ncbi:Transglutaminase-like superfamily protein [Paenibacillus sp. 1_12]|nr:Transglutaminase-like superfamily protein [Paenibacillus sp. 1_12]
MLRKLRTLCSLDIKTLCLLLEAFIYLGWARVLILLPFSKIAPSLGQSMQETSFSLNGDCLVVSKDLQRAIQIMSRHTIWESKCLVRAIAGLKMLERRRIESTLYLAIGKDETGKMIAHAWLRCGSCYITGSEGMERFTVVGKFAKTII